MDRLASACTRGLDLTFFVDNNDANMRIRGQGLYCSPS
jgi:hypothetical protein